MYYFKKGIKYLMLLCCVTLGLSVNAQADFDLRLFSSLSGTDYCVTLQVSNLSTLDLEVGGGSFGFSYNEDALSFSSYSSLEYDENTQCLGTFPYDPHTVVTNTPGIVTSFVIAASPNPFQTCVDVDCNWKDIAEICFNVIDPTMNSEIEFGTLADANSISASQNLSVNYILGDLVGVDDPLDGSGTIGDACNYLNVDVTYEVSATGVLTTFCPVDGTDNCAANTYIFTNNGSMDALVSEGDGCFSLDLQIDDMFDVSLDSSNGCTASGTGMVPANVGEEDCNGLAGGPDAPGQPCDDGDASTGNDEYTADCECIGVPLDCLGVPGGSTGLGSLCDDGDINTGNDMFNVFCDCIGQTIDCAGVAGGNSFEGSPCDDGDPLTGDDVYNAGCFCIGQAIDCAGVAGGGAGDGDPCDDGDPLTGDDVFDANCDCAGLILDCDGVAGGMASEGNPCDDGDPLTGDAVYDADCMCVGLLLDCMGVAGGTDLPGTTCDDGDPATTDTWDDNCNCVGVIVFDCEPLQSNIGDICNDFNDLTTNDVLGADCVCAGVSIFDCPTLMANIGDACDDGDSNTVGDAIDANCSCASGASIFICPDLMANPGDPCDDGNANTTNDEVKPECICAGDAFFDCEDLGVNIGDPCDDNFPQTVNDVYNEFCNCIGEPASCAFTFESVVTICESNDDYSLVLTISGTDQGDSFMLLDGTTVVAESNPNNPNLVVTLGPFPSGTGYDFEIVSANSTCNQNISAIAVDCVVTPLNLISFEGRATDAVNELNWVTGSEVEVSHFDVLRSNDGVSFFSVGQLNAEGSSTTTQSYQFEDKEFATGTNFYQLRMVDEDGTTSMSHVVDIRRVASTAISVFPVPVREVLNIQIQNQTFESGTVEIFDITGRMISAKQVDSNQAAEIVQISTSDLPAGSYLVKVQHGSEVSTAKFVK